MAIASPRAVDLHEAGNTIDGLDHDSPTLKDERLGPAQTRPKTFTGNADHVPEERSPPPRELTRALALRTSERERNKLYEERRTLVMKEFTQGLSGKETGRLGSITWILEQIEDAEMGPSLDALEAIADLVEAHARDLARYAKEARAAGKKPRSPFFSKATVKKQ